MNEKGDYMSCEKCFDLKIYEKEFRNWTRKTYVCYIDGHSSKDINELEETCPYLESIDL